MTVWYRLRLFGHVVGEIEVDSDQEFEVTYTPSSRDGAGAEHLVWGESDDNPALLAATQEDHADDPRPTL